MRLLRNQQRALGFITAGYLCLVVSVSQAATPVTAQSIGDLLIAMQYQAPATALSLNESRIAAEITARIKNIAVSVGDQVTAGSPLIALDCEAFELEGKRIDAGIKAMEAHVRLARLQLRRASKLVKQKSGSQELADQRRAELDSLNADLIGKKTLRAEAQRKVNRCEIIAPYDALILGRLAGEGEIAQSGTPLLTILDIKHIDVSARIRQSEADTLQHASHIWFETDGTRFPVTLRVLSPAIDVMARSREARLNFNKQKALPGASGRLIWEAQGHYLPAHFLLKRNGISGVFTADAGKAKFNPLPNALEGRPIQIAPSFMADKNLAHLLIIVKGRHGLIDGQDIGVTPEDEE